MYMALSCINNHSSDDKTGSIKTSFIKQIESPSITVKTCERKQLLECKQYIKSHQILKYCQQLANKKGGSRYKTHTLSVLQDIVQAVISIKYNDTYIHIKWNSTSTFLNILIFCVTNLVLTFNVLSKWFIMVC